MKRLPPGLVLTVGLLSAIALVASTAALLHHPTPRTVVERTREVIHEPGETVTVTVTVPGGERVVLKRTPAGYAVVTTKPTSTAPRSTTTTTGSGSGHPPATTTTTLLPSVPKVP